GPFVLLLAWFNSWAWWLLIGPLLLILLLFPSGRLLTCRWRWVVASLAATFALFFVTVTFSQTLQDPVSTGRYPNPVGFISAEAVDTILAPWQVLLGPNALLGVAALLPRLRRAGRVEREQIKWLAAAAALFGILYPIGFLAQSDNGPSFYNDLLDVGFLVVPLAIGVAILRYRLWDIDVLIRRTLVYAL